MAAFIVNKGGVYYSAQASEAAQQVPGFFFMGETDREFRNDIIAGIFAINRRAGALWALAVEPGVGHAVADPKSREILPASDAPPATYPTSWLPTETLARAWQTLVQGGSPHPT